MFTGLYLKQREEMCTYSEWGAERKRLGSNQAFDGGTTLSRMNVTSNKDFGCRGLVGVLGYCSLLSFGTLNGKTWVIVRYRNLEFSQCSLLCNRTGSGKIFDEEDVEEWFPQQKRPFLSRRCWGPISFRTSDHNLIHFIGRQAYVVCLVPQNTDTTVPTGTVVLYTYFIPSFASTATVATAKK